MKLKPFLLFAVGLAAVSILSGGPKTHPFMLVTADDFPALQEKAASPPFDAMVAHSRTMWDVPFKQDDFNRMASQLTYNMILYVVEEDPVARLAYKDQILWVIDQWEFYYPKLGTGHETTVYASSAQFTSLLALDLIYPDLTEAERSRAEGWLAQVSDWFLADQMKDGGRIPWKLAQIGAVTTWNIYAQNGVGIEHWVERYRHHLLDISMMSDGSWSQCAGYAHARVASSRSAKSNTADIIQANGYFDFYGNPQMKKLMDWLNAFALTPFDATTKFGESGGFATDLSRSNLFFYMGLYGPKAGAEASWHLRDLEHPPLYWLNNFITYVLMPLERPEPKMPVSLLMLNSGAALWGRVGGHQALSGVLYSLKRESWEEGSFHHACEDVNSVGLHGYGEFLIMNPGCNYNPGYPGFTPAGDRWYEAWMQNVVLVGDATRHASREGGGLLTGLTGGSIEFGLADAGQALGNGSHERALILIHEDGSAPGYFALVDRVIPDDPAAGVSILLQPNTKAGSTVVLEEGVRYRAPINGYVMNETAPAKSVRILFATPPDSVALKSAYKASAETGDILSDTLVGSLGPNRGIAAQVLTLVIPDVAGRPTSSVNLIKADGFAGAKVTFENGAVDWLLEADPTREFQADLSRFQARSLVYRDRGFLMIDGTLFLDGKGRGIASDQAIQAQFDRLTGLIQSEREVSVTLHWPGIQGVILDGVTVDAVDQGAGWLTVAVPTGRHEVTIID